MTVNCDVNLQFFICRHNVPVMFQDVGRLCQDYNGREIKKGVKLKSLTLNNGTLAMIFTLVLNQEVCVHFLQGRGENSPILAFSTSRTLRRRTQSTENE